MTTQPDSALSGTVRSRLIEIRLEDAEGRGVSPARIGVWVVVIALIYFVGLLAIVLWELPLVFSAVLVAAPILGCFAVLQIAVGRSRRRFLAVMDANWGLGDPGTIDFASILRNAPAAIGSWTFGAASSELALRLVRDGLSGWALRICQEHVAVDIVPVSAMFEPVKLDSADEGFQQLVEAIDLGRPDGNAADGSNRRWSLRSDRLGRMTIDLFIIAFAVVMMLNAGGNAPKVIGASMLLSWFAVRCVPALLAERQWFLVPGGVLIRKSRGLGKQWRRWLFSRRDSVLIVWSRRSGGQATWKALLRSEIGAESIRLNGVECEILLRAWMSPVAAPSLERLGDLA